MPGRDPEEEQICYRQSTRKCPLQSDLLISSPFAEVWQLFIKFWHLVILVFQLPCLSEILLLTRGYISLFISRNTCTFCRAFSRKFSDSRKNKLFCLCSIWTFSNRIKSVNLKKKIWKIGNLIAYPTFLQPKSIDPQGMKLGVTHYYPGWWTIKEKVGNSCWKGKGFIHNGETEHHFLKCQWNE